MVLSMVCHAQEADTLQSSATSSDFRRWYQTSDLVSYINYLSDDMLYETETTGEWNMPDRYLFTIRGNSYEQNRFYLNGFRLDSRFHSGSMLYTPDMRETSLHTDVERGIIYLQDDSIRRNELWLSGNMGNLGGISFGTKELINLFHESATERLIKPIEQRNHIRGAGQFSVAYGIPNEEETLHQRLYANAGCRRIVTFDGTGENGSYDAIFYKVQLAGDLPSAANWRFHYLIDMQHRPDLYSELGYNVNEVADYAGASLSLYGNRAWKSEHMSLTTGLTYALHDVRHQDLNFERNVVDQDGEGFDPWYADGKLHEVNWGVHFRKELLAEDATRPQVSVRADAYNSLLHWQAGASSWQNQVYCQYEKDREEWYQYQFEGQSFTGAILENIAAVDVHKRVNDWLHIKASAGLSWDGLLLRDKALVLPSWEAELAFQLRPTKWFSADILLGNYRSKYTWNQMRVLSSDYMNGVISGPNAPYAFHGGEYLHIAKGIQQPQYAVLDLPIVFTAKERHKFYILSTIRWYYHNWRIEQAQGGDKPYMLAYQPVVEGGGFFAIPVYLSNVVKYEYTGQKVYFSLSWQSYQMSGYTTLGNGAENNSIGFLSYSMLHPNAYTNIKNGASEVQVLNRLDADKSFILRMQLGVNFTDHWQLMANFHFQDGTPISNYRTSTGLIEAENTKGINPKDGYFGMRKDAFFNLDLRLRYQSEPVSVELTGYNLYDFGTAWYEYSFDEYWNRRRRTLSLCIPRGLTLRVCVGLNPVRRK